jgi:antibiotic biosynthesis monooxygenase (ABM) superfamily enzyme
MVTKTVKKTVKKSIKKQPKGLASWFKAPGQREASTLNDVKSSILVISVLLNLAVFIFWLVLQITSAYDEQVAGFLFNR